jgi:pyridoxamine 5'-phosphate oxidase
LPTPSIDNHSAVTTTIPDLDDPMILVGRWLDDAVDAATQPNPTAMTLATVGEDAKASARVVLVKGLDQTHGYAEFYTNYDSRKAGELASNAWAAGVMHWDALGRQLRFEGPVVESPAADSDAYFSQRPWRSQINAWASRQSRTVTDPNSLEKKARELASRFGTPDPFGDTDTVADGVSVPRPTFWGGYRFWFAAVEIWLSGKSRFHERVRYERSLEAVDEHSFRSGSWSHFRLQP